jgi:hypothetical protein
MPELDGWYVFGDYCSGRIWALDTASPDSPPILLTDAPYPISTFAQLPDGELAVLTYNRVIHRLVSDDTDDDDDGSPTKSKASAGHQTMMETAWSTTAACSSELLLRAALSVLTRSTMTLTAG